MTHPKTPEPWCPQDWDVQGNKHICWNQPGHDGEHWCLCGAVYSTALPAHSHE